MPKAHNFQANVSAIYAMDNAVRSQDNLSQLWAAKFGNHATTFGKSRQGERGVEQLRPQSRRGRWIIERDIGDDPF